MREGTVLSRTCTVESKTGDRHEKLLIEFLRPEAHHRFGAWWITAHLSCGSFHEKLRCPGEDQFDALTGMMQRVADRLKQIAGDKDLSIYWQTEGDLESGAFWGLPFAPWEIAVRSELSREFKERHPDLPKMLMPSVRVAIDEDAGSVHLFRVRPDGTDGFTTNIAAETIAAMEPAELAKLIGMRILLNSRFGRTLYGEAE